MRESAFTDAEFDGLPRYPDGSIIDLSMFSAWVTDAQRDRLSDDDWSRMIEYDEEISYLIADCY